MHVLFASPYSLMDHSYGAAASMRAVLSGVRALGHRCEALTGSYSPALPGREEGPPPVAAGRHGARVGAIPVDRIVDCGVEYTILKAAPGWKHHLLPHEMLFHLLLEEKLKAGRPDILLTMGRVAMLRRLLPLARSRRLPVAFYLNTAKQEIDAETLRQTDELIAPSQFLAGFYRGRFNLAVRVLRPIVSPELTVERRGARFVTLVNPAPEKGLTLLYALAAEAGTKLPQARFLVVEGRWTARDAAEFGVPLLDLPNVTVLGNQRDVRQVYARTRVLLFPAYREEAYGRTIVEAQLNGIPVIASRRGGIAEAINGAGFLLEIPKRCRENYRAVPRSDELRPWLATLTRLLTDPALLGSASRRARRAALPMCSGTADEAAALLQEVAACRKSTVSGTGNSNRSQWRSASACRERRNRLERLQ